MTTILLGAAGTGTSFGFASRLRANWGSGVRIVATDINEARLVTASLLADVFVTAPRADDPAFRETISALLRDHEVDIYVPVLNDEIRVAAALSEDPAHVSVDFWSSPQHAALLDKTHADAWLRDLGLPTPRAFAIDDIRSDGGAYFVKPRVGSGSIGSRRLAADELLALGADQIDQLVIQEVLDAPEITIDSFFDHEEDWGVAVCRERIETKAGVCTKARVFFDEALADYARRIGRGLRQKGAICFQVMSAPDGWRITDLNLRPGAGTALTCAAGFDVLSASFAARTGEHYRRFFPQPPFDETVYVTRQYAEFVMARGA